MATQGIEEVTEDAIRAVARDCSRNANKFKLTGEMNMLEELIGQRVVIDLRGEFGSVS